MDHQAKYSYKKKNIKRLKYILGRKLGTVNVLGSGMF